MTIARYYPLTALCVLLLLVLSFFSPPSTPLDDVTMIDKWAHFVMYGGTVAVLWFEYWRGRYRRGRVLTERALWLIAVVAPIALGGLVELGQAYCTGGRRSGEWLDWVADIVGVLLGCALGVSAVRWVCRRVWGSE